MRGLVAPVLFVGLAGLVGLTACSGTRPRPEPSGATTQPTEDPSRFHIRSDKPGAPTIAVRVIRAGTGREAIPGDVAVVHYTGRFADGQIFDTSRDGRPFQVKVLAGNVIRGWDLVLERMRIGDQWKVKIPYHLAYGDRGAPPHIPPRTDLFFEMELLDLK